ncbi:MAG: PIG-L family deacetylase [Candidatus Omnitrophica bacterium]|nr:PIG-L family deacetylase [Candidatus Omnitrophota bacterium]
MKHNILIVAAHPDDEILGCGGTVARLIKEGHAAYTLLLGEGVTSRDEERDPKKRGKEINSLRNQAQQANAALGVKEVFIHSFPDNRFDTVPLLDIVKVIEKTKEKVKPALVFTHYANDLNIDHRITCAAVLTATRPVLDETVKEIYSFEVPSSTEWNYPLSFSPNVYFDISQTIDVKLQAIKQYVSEIKEPPHPRSQEGVELNARMWGMKVGLGYAEAFTCVRRLA